jgi:hypothetical protein
MKMIYTLAAVFALSGASMADDAPRNCNTNWVGGACGPVSRTPRTLAIMLPRRTALKSRMPGTPGQGRLI